MGLFEAPKPPPAATPKKLAKPKLMVQSTPKLVPMKPQEPIKPKIAKSDWREARRSAAVGAGGALVFTRGRLKPLKWAALGGAAGGGADIAVRGRRRRIESELEVVKRYQPGDTLYRKETRVSPWRATEALAGVTLAATGGSRLRMVGAGIKAGTKLPGNKKLPFERAQSVRNAAQKGTRQVSPTLRRNDTVSGAMDLIPGRLRPAAATVGGMAMIGHARPVKREKYVLTNRRR